MRTPSQTPRPSALPLDQWKPRDGIIAAALFLASAAVVLWQNAHLCVLWDASYTVDTSLRIAQGQVPYRDFPLVHAPLTFLMQAAIIRLFGRVFFDQVLYAALAGGVGTVLAWRIVLDTLIGTPRGHIRAAWAISLLLAAPLALLGIYSILPFPSYDCDSALAVLAVICLWQRLEKNQSKRAPGECLQCGFFLRKKPLEKIASGDSYSDFALAAGPATEYASPARRLLRPFLTGATLALPLFVKQNIGLPFVLVAVALLLLLPVARRLRGNPAFENGRAAWGAILAGAGAALLVAGLLLHWTAGLGNYFYWTIQFACQRRLPGLSTMLGVYAEPSLLWSLPAVAVALTLLQSRFAQALWARLTSLSLLSAPFLFALAGLFLSTDADDRADSLLALWPLVLLLAAALTLYQLWRAPSLRALLSALVLVAIHGTLLSQQLWGSTYAIWPLLVVLIAEMIAFLAALEAAVSTARANFLAPAMAAVVAVTLLICGGLYAGSEERLSHYASLPEGPVLHSSYPALRGMAVSGPFLPDFEELLRFSAQNIPASDGLILLPGEDPFYFATGRKPQFPVLLFDPATDPYSPAQLVAEARQRGIRWLIVKRTLQIKQDVTPQRAATLAALEKVFLPYRQLKSYDIYRRP